MELVYCRVADALLPPHNHGLSSRFRNVLGIRFNFFCIGLVLHEKPFKNCFSDGLLHLGKLDDWERWTLGILVRRGRLIVWETSPEDSQEIYCDAN